MTVEENRVWSEKNNEKQRKKYKVKVEKEGKTYESQNSTLSSEAKIARVKAMLVKGDIKRDPSWNTLHFPSLPSRDVSWSFKADSPILEIKLWGEPRDPTFSNLLLPDDGLLNFEMKTDEATGEKSLWLICAFSTYALAERSMGWTQYSVSKALLLNGFVAGVKGGRHFFVRRFHDKSASLMQIASALSSSGASGSLVS
jgi:hypothetical protein